MLHLDVEGSLHAIPTTSVLCMNCRMDASFSQLPEDGDEGEGGHREGEK